MPQLSLLLVLLLAGCTFMQPRTTEWERAGTTPEEAGNDLAACHHAAQKRVDQDLQLDQDAGGDTASRGSLAANLAADQADRRLRSLTRDCMLALDYHPAGTTAP
jgi:hypothetical protein